MRLVRPAVVLAAAAFMIPVLAVAQAPQDASRSVPGGGIAVPGWQPNAAVHKAEAPGQQVTQSVALSVKGDKVECAINGATVATYDKSQIVGDGKLKSTDDVYGLRFAHNTEVLMTDLKISHP